jgi:hypothetical protein
MGHWYNKDLKVRAETQYIFPDGRVLDSTNADSSPVDGWEWHDSPPEWFEELERLNSTENDEHENDG